MALDPAARYAGRLRRYRVGKATVTVSGARLYDVPQRQHGQIGVERGDEYTITVQPHSDQLEPHEETVRRHRGNGAAHSEAAERADEIRELLSGKGIEINRCRYLL